MASAARQGTLASNLGGGPGWAYPEAVLLNNGNTTSVSIVANYQTASYPSAQLFTYGYGYTIPAAAVINGIEFLAQIYCNGAQAYDYGAPQLYYAGSAKGSSKARPYDYNNGPNQWPTSGLTNVTFGSPTDLWGTTWTATQINDSSFGVGLAAVNMGFGGGTGQAYTQWFQLTVYWTPNVSLTASTANSVSVSDAATRAAYACARAIANTVTRNDVAARTLSKALTAADSTSRSDAATRIKAGGRAMTDTVAASDTAVRFLTRVRIPVDASSVADSASRALLSRSRTATDTVTRADTATIPVALLRSSSDLVAVSDAAQRLSLHPGRTGSNPVTGPTDSATRAVRAMVRSSADVVSRSDAATRNAVKIRAGADTLSVLDSAGRYVLSARTLAEAVSLSDVATFVYLPPSIKYPTTVAPDARSLLAVVDLPSLLVALSDPSLGVVVDARTLAALLDDRTLLVDYSTMTRTVTL